MEALLQQHSVPGLAASLRELGVLDLQELVGRQEDVLTANAHFKAIPKRKLENLLQAAEKALRDEKELQEAYRFECWQLSELTGVLLDDEDRDVSKRIFKPLAKRMLEASRDTHQTTARQLREVLVTKGVKVATMEDYTPSQTGKVRITGRCDERRVFFAEEVTDSSAAGPTHVPVCTEQHSNKSSDTIMTTTFKICQLFYNTMTGAPSDAAVQQQQQQEKYQYINVNSNNQEQSNDYSSSSSDSRKTKRAIKKQRGREQQQREQEQREQQQREQQQREQQHQQREQQREQQEREQQQREEQQEKQQHHQREQQQQQQ
ncbi:hypothetical protein B484DRAFT_114600, partial [Ochromonadaceae sp. CCMP2298]